jgi:hypothetical protein
MCYSKKNKGMATALVTRWQPSIQFRPQFGIPETLISYSNAINLAIRPRVNVFADTTV